MKNILFNCSTNIIGGGAKNAAYFIKNSIDINNFKYFYAVSPNVYHILSEWGFIPNNIFVFKKSLQKIYFHVKNY